MLIHQENEIRKIYQKMGITYIVNMITYSSFEYMSVAMQQLRHVKEISSSSSCDFHRTELLLGDK